ncbi:uncharacterized protein LOC112506094 [Cynara cardunculus var. scolymus]|uniref:uncharacterized protein LOC112506094 n=1 Tax=Cynara cardunculus var. scolymus TaxID=59895 RepID=UPI000D6310EA|nr:uncharacterized protein LOC112506094 [Cynara cardunculus var. scolymus]
MTCYSCSAIGHRQRECPRSKPEESKASVRRPSTSGAPRQKEEVPRVQARAFQITTEEARDKPDVVMGIFLVNSHPARILFDSDAPVLALLEGSDDLVVYSDPSKLGLGSVLMQRGNVKAEHQKSYGSLQPLDIPVWKWEGLTMDFVTKLPKTSRQHDSIWVVVDRLTKSAHFLPVIFDRDSRFTSKFWANLQRELGTHVAFSTSYHPQTDGQSERTIQTLEDMLRVCILEFGGSWDMHLPLVEFSYNNNSHSTIGMAPFEALYGRKCRTTLCWRETGEKVLARPEMIQITHDKIQVIRERMKAAQDRQKSYANNRRRPIEFTVSDMVMLKVSPWKGILRFGKQEELSGIHDVFHVGYLRKCLGKYDETIPLVEVKIDKRLRYIKEPKEILNERTANLRNKTIDLVLVKWKHHRGPNCMWENKEQMFAKYPKLFEK